MIDCSGLEQQFCQSVIICTQRINTANLTQSVEAKAACDKVLAEWKSINNERLNSRLKNYDDTVIKAAKGLK